MQNLPYDVIHMIVSQLRLDLRPERRRDRTLFVLSPYAGICKSWNSAIEHKTFQPLFLRPERLDYAEQVLSNDPRRRSVVREVRFHSYYSHSESLERDLSYKQVSERDKAFSRDVSRLFGFLAAGEAGNQDIEQFRNLYLVMQPLIHLGEPPEYDTESDNLDSNANEYRDIKYDPAFLRYVGATLPTIHCVKKFELGGDAGQIWPSSLAAILLTIDGVELCQLPLNDDPTVNPNLCIKYRKVLANNLFRIPATCDTVSITTEDDLFSYLAELQSLYPQPRFPPEGLDSLSIGLRDLSMRLVSLWLDGMAISTSLFWPDKEELLSTLPYWPRLEYVHVRYSPASASGEWLAHVNEDKSIHEWQKVGVERNYIDHEGTNRLFIAAGKAARRMPALRHMTLEMRNSSIASISFTYEYDGELEVFLATWDSWRSRFRLSSATLQAFNISKEQLETGISKEWTQEPFDENQMYGWARAYIANNGN